MEIPGVNRLTVNIRGRVQGVGFRYATHAQAQSLGVSGWVRNQPDGAVEAVFFGPRRTLEQMLAWCQSGPRGAHVDRVDAQWDEAEEAPLNFTIR